MIHADEICWQLALSPAPDLLAMSDEDLLVATLVEADAYRALCLAAIHALHDLTVQHDRLRAQHHGLIGAYRALRVQTVRPEAA